MRSKKETQRLYMYGISPKRFDAMYIAQEGRCRICWEPVEATRMHVDHNHNSGTVRGLLCAGCNLGLGHFRENPSALRAAAIYIDRANARDRKTKQELLEDRQRWGPDINPTNDVKS